MLERQAIRPELGVMAPQCRQRKGNQSSYHRIEPAHIETWRPVRQQAFQRKQSDIQPEWQAANEYGRHKEAGSSFKLQVTRTGRVASPHTLSCGLQLESCNWCYLSPDTPLLIAAASAAGAAGVAADSAGAVGVVSAAVAGASLPASANSPTYSILASAFTLSSSALAAFWRASFCNRRAMAGLACSSVTGCTCESANKITSRPSNKNTTKANPTNKTTRKGRSACGNCSAGFTPCEAC